MVHYPTNVHAFGKDAMEGGQELLETPYGVVGPSSMGMEASEARQHTLALCSPRLQAHHL